MSDERPVAPKIEETKVPGFLRDAEADAVVGAAAVPGAAGAGAAGEPDQAMRTRVRRTSDGGLPAIFMIDALALLLVAAVGTASWTLIGSTHPSPIVAQASPTRDETAAATQTAGVPGGSSSTAPSASPVVSLAVGDGKWARSESLPRAIWGSGGVLLADGRFMVLGGAAGASSTNASSAVSIYDPATGHWVSATSMLQARAYPTAALLRDGSVLVAGGVRNGQPLDTAERYFPSNGTWVAAGRLNLPRAQGTITVLGDGRALAVGGGIEGNPNWTSTASAELYDPVRNSWKLTEPMAVPRSFHSATLMPDGEVLVTGGGTTWYGERGGVTAGSEAFNPRTNSWRQVASMSIPRYAHQAVLLSDGRLLVSGGWSATKNSDLSKASAETYDPAADVWTATGSMADARADFVMVGLPDGRVLAAGGIDRRYRVLDSAELFDPVTGDWQITGKLPVAIWWPASAVFPDGRVLFAGGATDVVGSGRTATCEIYTAPPR
jgi:N-acetylneuraminic acid mutarotase